HQVSVRRNGSLPSASAWRSPAVAASGDRSSGRPGVSSGFAPLAAYLAVIAGKRRGRGLQPGDRPAVRAVQHQVGRRWAPRGAEDEGTGVIGDPAQVAHVIPAKGAHPYIIAASCSCRRSIWFSTPALKP